MLVIGLCFGSYECARIATDIVFTLPCSYSDIVQLLGLVYPGNTTVSVPHDAK